jgi:hypothetical protein
MKPPDDSRRRREQPDVETPLDHKQPGCLETFVGSAPMSARKPIACSPLPERSTPTTPVPPMHLDPPFGELGSHHVRCAVLFQAQLRIGMQIAADLGKLVLIAGDGVMG